MFTTSIFICNGLHERSGSRKEIELASHFQGVKQLAATSLDLKISRNGYYTCRNNYYGKW